jgi:hypothetical protein
MTSQGRWTDPALTLAAAPTAGNARELARVIARTIEPLRWDKTITNEQIGHAILAALEDEGAL